ncbi:craniofacial development protein 2-like [Bactrocera neohumeralis]|uniref:craniofacial development protein 2-like n=1 Tax=Bactrocera neohumeralis TaxID=98809 RepID=UPI002165229C|nr:craniofacial development protein 2-like [Bactrocera neohumeralis]XP_050337804.1 craniofacial development protein 2-like [Bactrocera neohumeralis]
MAQAAHYFRSLTKYPLGSLRTSVRRRAKVRRRNIPHIGLCAGFGTRHVKKTPPVKSHNQPRMRDPPFDDDHGKRNKDYELRACTWNVRSLNWEGAAAQLVDVLVKTKADITAVQEMRWTGQGQRRVGPCDIYYSGHIKERKFGVGFVVGERLRRRVLSFTAMNERLATIRIKARFFNISLICAHAPTEEKDDVTKDAFYECLERTYEGCPRHDVKIVLGDFNERVGKEGVFGTTVGKFGLHDETSPNGLRLIDFAGARNMVICSTRFQHKKIHQATWLSPDRKNTNQIDHVVIDGRHVSSVLDVRALRGPNIDSDHYLVAAKIRTRLCAAKNARHQTQGRFDVEKLQSQQTAERFSTRLVLLLSESTRQQLGIRELWDGILNSCSCNRNHWFSESAKEQLVRRGVPRRSGEKTG